MSWKRLLIAIAGSALISLLGCSGYRHTICVSADAPVLVEFTGGKKTTFKLEYRLDETPSQR